MADSTIKGGIPSPYTSAVDTDLSRRQLLATLSASCAGLLAPSALAGGFAYNRKAGGSKGKGKLLSAEQLAVLAAMVEVIIPQTDTLGAGSVDTHGFIDDQLANCTNPKEAKVFVAQLELCRNLILKQWGKAYPSLTTNDQNAAMQLLTTNQAPFEKVGSDFFTKLKSLTLFGYYTSKEGGSKELVYLPIAGGYDGDFKLSENGGKAFMPHQI
ncbi:gluconate 2-dehydrogenase subunit 3 family protein [Saccharophagus degradans]|uniref:gluconate 2-dehydrogenase subunit 3 family protein n=1 Tax=Saccharophagus degradans TaxID=86304 RepID=UPI001C08B426|nr:gluconate 2-dehydrogenase subunit 3 family protein [Saccharophagus degradans]MBU2987433.1 gluconate 2-dehydrogenase subunit 3 family protein [Saccharophagus degradans]